MLNFSIYWFIQPPCRNEGAIFCPKDVQTSCPKVPVYFLDNFQTKYPEKNFVVFWTKYWTNNFIFFHIQAKIGQNFFQFWPEYVQYFVQKTKKIFLNILSENLSKNVPELLDNSFGHLLDKILPLHFYMGLPIGYCIQKIVKNLSITII